MLSKEKTRLVPLNARPFIRPREIPEFLSMSISSFNKYLKPYLTKITIGVQGVAYCRKEIEDLLIKIAKKPEEVRTPYIPICFDDMNTNTKFNERLLLSRMEASEYISTNKNWFHTEIKKHLHTLKIGSNIYFIRVEIQSWSADYKKRVGRPGRNYLEELTCQNDHQVSQSEANSGTSTKSSMETEFTKALKQVTLTRPKDT